MILAKYFKSLNSRKAFKKAINSLYMYTIYGLTMPLKMSKKNLSKYSLHEEHKEIGVILNNNSTLDKAVNHVLFNEKKAFAQSFQNRIIVKLIQPIELKYDEWVKTIQKYIYSLNPAFIMIPINRNINVQSLSSCNLVIQELNPILFNFAFDSYIIIYQEEEPLSSLAYIIQHTAFPSRTSLCLNLDFMENVNYTLNDILEDINKFNIQNKISMIQTNKYSIHDKRFKTFLSFLSEDVIVFGEKI